MEEGVKAKIALEGRGMHRSRWREKVIEANTLLSVSVFESAGLAGAHTIHNGMTVLEECHSMSTAKKVALVRSHSWYFGRTFRRKNWKEVIDFCIEVGLRLPGKEAWCRTYHRRADHGSGESSMLKERYTCNMPFEVTPETVAAALKAADAYGRYYLERNKKEKHMTAADGRVVICRFMEKFS